MENLLFINACVRGERSRTLKLARRFLDAYRAAHPDTVITERDLCAARLQPQYPEVVGLCRASKLLYITTRGGNYAGTPMETATPVLKALCTMYGIPEFQCLDAEGLDDIRNDKEALLADAARRAEALAEVF